MDEGLAAEVMGAPENKKKTAPRRRRQVWGNTVGFLLFQRLVEEGEYFSVPVGAVVDLCERRARTYFAG